MRINNISHVKVLQPSSGGMTHGNFNNNYTGFFGLELKTCSTIEEGIKSFEDLEERNRIKRLPKNFNESEL